MNQPLVVLNGADMEQELIQEAITLAAATQSSVEFLGVFDSDEVERQRETLESIADIEGTGYRPDTARSLAQQSINQGLEATGVDIEYELTVVTDDESNHADIILEACDERDCDHIFIAGATRSPTGKAVFGDIVQRVLLNATVPVTARLGS